jgi:hypothetical protein
MSYYCLPNFVYITIVKTTGGSRAEIFEPPGRT